MSVSDRPYIGTWSLNNRKLVQHTPDALVYINGDTAIPGCAKCSSFIDIQKFVTQVSVDAGTDSAAAQANFTLSVPQHHVDSLARDAQFLLRPGLEVHIYMRGYFPVTGMYTNFANLWNEPPPSERGPDTRQVQGGDIPPPTTALEDLGMTDTAVDRLLAYPYYHTFHGVVTSVAHSWSPGTQTITVNCSSILHFWGFHQISTNAAWFGARPKNSKARSSLLGHNFTGMHPYEIMYTLHQDTAGAAAGISFALQRKSNTAATDEILGESYFSLNLKYWENRFNRRDIKLRMHGLSGQLFNSAQAAFLARLKTQQLSELIRSKYLVGAGKRPTAFLSTLAEGARQLGLNFGDLEVLQRNNDRNTDDPITTNVADLHAFAYDHGQVAQANFFESTYESKLDMALKVCEVTGFEFFQDVDGDFVFKPPMYNLDTSSSRVYRLEEIDIISINFTEQEPQATYFTLKGETFKNQKGFGMDNEFGVQAQYIDFRLVAQFGWRPANAETSYLSDPKSLFFSAINRLDLQNVKSKTATVTIPIRPELRPGYPVYIPYLDCFYYCPSFNHNYTVGGQCTTSLTLEGKRAKFYAPGRPSKANEGIAAIDLSNPALPPMPLEVDDLEGKRRLAGFPNVVMALDPLQLDPAFFTVNADFRLIDDPSTLKGLLDMAVAQNVLKPVDGQPGYYEISQADDSKVVYFFDTGLEKNAGKPPKNGSTDKNGRRVVSVSQAAANYASTQAAFRKVEATQVEETEKNNKKISELSAKIAAQRGVDVEGLYKDLAELQQKNQKIQDDFASAQNTFRDTGLVEGAKAPEGVTDLLNLMKLVQNRLDIGNGSGPTDVNSSATLLDLLSSKKALMTNAETPGTYRYYSASHPDPEQQGQPIIVANKEKGKRIIDETDPVVPADKANEVATFIPYTGITNRPNGSPPQATLEKRKPKWGLKIRTNANSKGEVIPTDQIQELMFAVHEIVATTYRQSSSPSTPAQTTIPKTYQEGVLSAYKRVAQDAPKDYAPISVFAEVSNALSSYVDGAHTAGLEAYEKAKGAKFSAPARVNTYQTLSSKHLIVNGNDLDPTQPLNGYRFLDDSPPDTARAEAFNTVVTGGTVTYPKPSEARIQAARGTEVKSPAAGIVTSAQTEEQRYATTPDGKRFLNSPPGLQGIVRVETEGGETLLYSYLATIAVKAGQRITAGQVLGTVGGAPGGGGFVSFNVDRDGKTIPPAQSRVFLKTPFKTSWMLVAEAAVARDLVMTNYATEVAAAMKAAKASQTAIEQYKTAFYNYLLARYDPTAAPLVAAAPAAQGVSGPTMKTLTTAVFPVSDAGGYEVIGSMRYGRGISIEPNGVFDVLRKIDPFSMLSKKTVDDIVTGLTKPDGFGFIKSRLKFKTREEFNANPAGDPIKETIDVVIPSGLQDRIRTELKQYLGDDALTLNLDGDSLTDLGLSNTLADKSRDRLMKVPLVNAGYSLADINVRTGKNLCTCKAAEADVLLSFANQTEQFVPVMGGSQPVTGDRIGTADRITPWLTDQTMRAIPSWVEARRNIQGDNTNQPRVNVVAQTIDAVNQFLDQPANILGATANLINAANNVGQGNT